MDHTNKKRQQAQIVNAIIFALIIVCFIWQVAPLLIYVSSNDAISDLSYQLHPGSSSNPTPARPDPEQPAQPNAGYEIETETKTETEIITKIITEPEAVFEFPEKTEAPSATGEHLSEAEAAAAEPAELTASVPEVPEVTEITEPPTPDRNSRQFNGISEGDIIIGEATHYCACARCNGKHSGITSSGYVIENGVQSYTAGCNWLPFGTVIEVRGVQYTIRDRGGSWFNTVGNIDIFVPEGHQAAWDRGRLRNIEIKIVSLPG
jgi:hypothetical protein